MCAIFLPDAGVNSNRSSGSAAGQHQQQRKDSRQHSDSSTGSYSDARGTLSGRDSIISTLAQRLTLSNLLTRKPAPDNTTRESFN
jgi:DNA repair exonuclease SbcCD ATPase subunit